VAFCLILVGCAVRRFRIDACLAWQLVALALAGNLAGNLHLSISEWRISLEISAIKSYSASVRSTMQVPSRRAYSNRCYLPRFRPSPWPCTRSSSCSRLLEGIFRSSLCCCCSPFGQPAISRRAREHSALASGNLGGPDSCLGARLLVFPTAKICWASTLKLPVQTGTRCRPYGSRVEEACLSNYGPRVSLGISALLPAAK